MATNRRDEAAAETRERILAAALEEFSRQGFAGARLEVIAAQSGNAKRMIYYYFQSKEGLYLAVLERAYRDIREVEAALDLHALPPREALRVLTRFTLDYHEHNPAFVRLIALENIQHGKFVNQLPHVGEINSTVLNAIDDILTRGVASGDFRPGIAPVDVHLTMSAFCAFRADHRYTFSRLFGEDLFSPGQRAHHEDLLFELMLRYLRP